MLSRLISRAYNPFCMNIGTPHMDFEGLMLTEDADKINDRTIEKSPDNAKGKINFRKMHSLNSSRALVIFPCSISFCFFNATSIHFFSLLDNPTITGSDYCKC